MSQILILLFSVNLSFFSIYAQDLNDEILWSQIRVDGKIKNAFTLGHKNFDLLHSTEFHHRLKNEFKDFAQLILRPMLGLELSKHTVIWSGVAYIATEVNGEITNEVRPFQLITYSIGPSETQFRFLLGTRLEQRLLEDEEQISLRLRQFLKLNYDFYKKENHTLSLFFQDEAFFRLNNTEWAGETGFDQNRIWVGVEYIYDHPDYRLTLGLGYNQQYFLNRSNHGVHVLVRISLK